MAEISDIELNEVLDGLINEEFSDISIYTGEAVLFTDKLVGGNRIAETFSAFAREEMEHARALMKLASRTGGIRARNIAVGSSLRQCLAMHVKREAVAVTLYKRLSTILTEPDHKLIIKGIIAQEAEHLRTAKDYLLKIQASNK